jgi:glycosyltransferase involved in cell wall biosynthesis
MELVSQTAVARGARRGITSFPPAIPQNPYQRLLYEHLDDLGYPLEDFSRFDVGSLLRARRHVGALHFHWPQGYYRHEGRGAFVASWLKLVLLTWRLAVARVLRYHVLWTVHQVYPHERGSRGTDRAAAVILSHAANSLIVHDLTTAEKVGVELPWAAAKLAVVPHGSYEGVYPTGRSRAQVRSELGLAETSVVFLAFGHVRGYKDLDVLLDGFAAADCPDLALVVAGLPLDGPSAGLVLARARTDARIKPRLGFIPDEEVAELFGAADAAVITRGDGGTSGALILALSMGTPAVVADARGYLELIEDGKAGWAFTAGDPKSLGCALDAAAADVYEFASKRDAARRVASRLSWPEAARRTAALITKRAA